MTRRRSVRSDLYRTARVMGDVQAAMRGPGAYGRRRVRKVAYRSTNRGLYRLLKSLGLGR